MFGASITEHNSNTGAAEHKLWGAGGHTTKSPLGHSEVNIQRRTCREEHSQEPLADLQCLQVQELPHTLISLSFKSTFKHLNSFSDFSDTKITGEATTRTGKTSVLKSVSF